MRLGDRQVDDDFHGRVGEKRVDAGCLKAEFIRPGFRGLRVHIRKAANVENGERRHGLEIGAGDVAAADDADTDLFHVIPPVNQKCRILCTSLSARAASPVVFHGDS